LRCSPIVETRAADPNIPCFNRGSGNILFTALASGRDQVAIALLSPSLKYAHSINLNDVLPKNYRSGLTALQPYPAIAGDSMLHIAIKHKHIALAQALLSTELNSGLSRSHKIDINQVDAVGYSGLHRAAVAGDIEMVMLLIDKYADVAQRIDISKKRGKRFLTLFGCPSQQKQTALHLAARGGHHEIVTLPANKMTAKQIEARDGRHHSALIAAVNEPNVDQGKVKQCVQALIMNGIPLAELRWAQVFARDLGVLTEINSVIDRQEQMKNG
jgi:ankyrin repeat protein